MENNIFGLHNKGNTNISVKSLKKEAKEIAENIYSKDRVIPTSEELTKEFLLCSSAAYGHVFGEKVKELNKIYGMTESDYQHAIRSIELDDIDKEKGSLFRQKFKSNLPATNSALRYPMILAVLEEVYLNNPSARKHAQEQFIEKYVKQHMKDINTKRHESNLLNFDKNLINFSNKKTKSGGAKPHNKTRKIKKSFFGLF